MMKDIAIKPAEIILPDTSDMTAWACIACDQFTSEINYWKKLESEVKGKPTTLDLIFPEIYLADDPDGRIKRINENIKEYERKGIFKTLPKGYILTVRTTPFVKRRIGLIGAIDLTKYDFKAGSTQQVRATEGTIEERISPRLKIRKDADVEFPHIMVLFDDEKREINEELYARRNEFEKLYDFTLNMGGGRVEGYFISDCDLIEKKFAALLDSERLIKKYGKDDKFLFAVGDGNHSLATAKRHFEKVTENLSDEEKLNHPARYALCEFNNIYDEGIYFEPIFRFVKGINKEKFIKGLNVLDIGNAAIYSGELKNVLGALDIPSGIKSADEYIKKYISENGGEVDYIHGESNLKELVDNTPDSVGIIFNKIQKEDLFKYVVNNGPFPKKTFSMGEGIEKRYYLEGRKIR